MTGKSLNARPASAFNQRSAVPNKQGKAMSPRNPYGNMKDQSNYMREAHGAKSDPVGANMSKKSFGEGTVPVGQNQQTISSDNNISNQAVSSNNVQSSPQSNYSENTSTMSVETLISVFRSMVGPFAILSDDVIQKNLDLAAGIGMSNDDRTLPFECASYLMMNMSYMLMGLVLDASFKDSFSSAVLVEMNLDEKSPDEVKKARDEMNISHPFVSDGAIILGVTTFIPRVSDFFMNKMHESFDALNPYADEFNKAVEALSYDYRLELGFIFSNFMYLIRAFTHNHVFMSYVITVVEKVKELVASSN